MNLSRLLLAGMLATLPCACKKDGGSDGSSGDRSGARTKSAAREEDESHDGRTGTRRPAPVDSREAAELIDAAEAAYKAHREVASRIVGLEGEQFLARTLNNEAEQARIQERLEEATKQSTEAERDYAKALDAVRSRQQKDPEERLGAYLAFATQRDLFAAKRKEIAGAGTSGSEEDAMKAREKLREEVARLRELRAAWKGDEKTSGPPPEPAE